MQTFLPYSSFFKTAISLDYKRLGNQRVEAKQLLSTLKGLSQGKGWANHPACLMWKGHESLLARYGLVMCTEWKIRGYNDNLTAFFLKHIDAKPKKNPSWLGNSAFHASHRSNLLRKDPEWYGQFEWTEPNDLPYVWPVRKT